MTTLLLYGVTAVFVPNPKGVSMKRNRLIPLSLVVSALASGTILADEHSQSKIDSLESRLDALQRQVDGNNLDSVSKLHLAGYSNVDFIAGSDNQEDGFTNA